MIAHIMAPTTPPSPISGILAGGQRRSADAPVPRSSLNPTASPFSPSLFADTAAEELTEWLIFSPSSFEGRSGRPSSTSPATSFADVVRCGECSCVGAAGSSSRPPSCFVEVSPPFVRREGKAPTEEVAPLASRGHAPSGAPGGFMADARRSSAIASHGRTAAGLATGARRAAPAAPVVPAVLAARAAQGQPPADASEGWQVVTHRKKWRRIAQRAPPPLPRRPVPADLVGKCFNCLRSGHVALDCTNVTRCLRCHREGHQARSCKRPRWPDAGGPSPRPPKVAPMRPGGSTLPSQQGSATPPEMEQAPTPEGSPSPHVIPSPPHGPSPPSQEPPLQPPASPSSLVRPRRFELRVIPRTQAIDEAEAALANALVVLVGGNRPTLSPEQVRHHLSRFYAIRDGEVQVKRYSCSSSAVGGSGASRSSSPSGRIRAHLPPLEPASRLLV
jgi:hypothetical protein